MSNANNMTAMEYISMHRGLVDDERQGEEWGTEADWDCLIDDVLSGVASVDDCGTGGVEQDDIDLVVQALTQGTGLTLAEVRRGG